MKKEIKTLIEKIEDQGWSVSEDGENQYMLSQYSPAGQDFNTRIEGETADDLINDLYERYENFDVSEEAYLWLDDTGHGKNGAPYDMRDLYNDMEECEQMILNLYNELKEC